MIAEYPYLSPVSDIVMEGPCLHLVLSQVTEWPCLIIVDTVKHCVQVSWHLASSSWNFFFFLIVVTPTSQTY